MYHIYKIIRTNLLHASHNPNIMERKKHDKNFETPRCYKNAHQTNFKGIWQRLGH